MLSAMFRIRIFGDTQVFTNKFQRPFFSKSFFFVESWWIFFYIGLDPYDFEKTDPDPDPAKNRPDPQD
jgi:hypothetical protein